MSPRDHFKALHYTNHVKSLQKACEWVGIPKGRASIYGRLIREFFEDSKRSREHVLAYNESCEIIEIYELWEASISNFPGLEQRIRTVFSKGPVLREDERPDTSSNKARNDAFVYLLAGKLVKADLEVMAVDGIVAKGISCHKDADTTFGWNKLIIDIESKRPQKEKALLERVKEARDQLTGTNRSGRVGIIGVDCSAFIRPTGKLLEADSAESAEQFLSRCLEEEVKPKVEAYLESCILGFLLFARAPGMILTLSPIVSSDGKPVTYFRPYSISTLLVTNNSNSSNPDALRFISERLRRSCSQSKIAY